MLIIGGMAPNPKGVIIIVTVVVTSHFYNDPGLTHEIYKILHFMWEQTTLYNIMYTPSPSRATAWGGGAVDFVFLLY